MRRFHVDATWRDGAVEVTLDRIEPLDPQQHQRMLQRGMMKPDDDPVGRSEIGRIEITEPRQMTPKRVRRAALDWLAEHAGMSDDDSYEMQIAVKSDLDALTRLEAALDA
jgi:hypothetical protein